MRNNATTFSHPETIRKIRGALWVARIEAKKKARRAAKNANLSGYVPSPRYEGRQYVTNRKGHNYLRVSVYSDGSFHIWGDCSREVTDLVLAGAIKAN